jgi:hypothetical protein
MSVIQTLFLYAGLNLPFSPLMTSLLEGIIFEEFDQRVTVKTKSPLISKEYSPLKPLLRTITSYT